MARAHVEYPLSGKHGTGHVTLVDIDVYEVLAACNKKVSMRNGYTQLRPLDAPPGGWVTPISLHRMVMGLSPGDGKAVDHINHDRLDNRRENLRIVTLAENNANSGAAKKGRGPFAKGVYPMRNGRFRAAAKYAGEQFHLGCFDTMREAWEVAEAWRRENIVGYVPQPH